MHNKAKQHRSLRSLDSLFVALFVQASPLSHKNRNKKSAVVGGVRFTMKLNFLFIPIVLLLTACAHKAHPDLSHYTINDFLNHPAYCTNVSQCKSIGYGEQNYGCPSNPVFEGFVTYSTKMGSKNILHLENLAKESRFFKEHSFFSNKALLLKASFELEECLGIGNHIPKLMCLENRCVDNFWNEI